MKVIFLDIDGVLNRHDFDLVALSNPIHREMTLRLNRILEATNAKVVVISAWRYMILQGAISLLGFEYLLRTHGVVEGCLVDCTVSDEQINGRWNQIKKWLREHELVEGFVVIDDLDELYPEEARGLLVSPDGKVGLTDSEVERAIEILNQEQKALVYSRANEVTP